MAATSETISEAFDLIFADDDPKRRRSAIVVFQPPEQDLESLGRALRKNHDSSSFSF